MRRDEERIERLADSIASGRPVDPAVLDGLGEDDSSIVANLISLSRLSDLHRVRDPGRVAGADPATETWGTLRILEKVGEGSFGEVFRAWDTQLHRLVALKLQRGGEDAGPAERTLEEGRLLAKVDHPGVVRIHGGATHGGRSGLWMEVVEGETLEAALRSAGPLDPGEAARVGAELCEALAAIHDAGLVHGDVKAQNVVRERGGRVVLMDFGSGSRAWSGGGAGPRTGTPAYTPPEIFAGERPSPRSDVFSLGVLLFALLADRFPVRADSMEELAEALRTGRRDRLRDVRPDVPAGLAGAVEQAMDSDPARRFRSAREMGAALRAWAPATPDPAAEPRRATRVLPWAVALAAVAIAVVLLVRPPASGPLVSEARMLRGADPAEQLFSGDVVGEGDLLHLRLDLARDSWIYILNRDDRGSLSLLFPLPGYALQNPVPAGDDVAVPGPRAGSLREMAWAMGGGGGTERFLVIAAARPLQDFESELARLPLPGESATARALGDPAADELYRGVAGLARLPSAPAGAGTAAERLFSLAAGLRDAGDGSVWVRELELRNP
jgi:hypothetical protein